MTTPSPVDVARIEDVTIEHLGGASEYELAAFQTAVLEYVLDAHVSIHTATLVIYGEGNWREVVAERCPLAWPLAQRRTAEERGR